MKKTYFEELLATISDIDNPDTVTKYIIEDCMHKALSSRESHDENIDWENSAYIKRQLDFLVSCLNRNK